MLRKLASGRELYSNGDIWGLGPDLQLYEGYDGAVYFDDDIPEAALSAEEKSELSKLMIARWMLWALK